VWIERSVNWEIVGKTFLCDKELVAGSNPSEIKMTIVDMGDTEADITYQQIIYTDDHSEIEHETKREEPTKAEYFERHSDEIVENSYIRIVGSTLSGDGFSGGSFTFFIFPNKVYYAEGRSNKWKDTYNEAREVS
jgi:hypothetical protein